MANDRPPPQIPDHTLLGQIGSGSYGEVWLARSRLGTLRAVKIVHRSAFEDERPFQREFKGIQRFEPISRSHEGLVDILQVGGDEACFYYVMELADDVGKPNPESHADATDGRASDFGMPSDSGSRPSDLYRPRTLRSDLRQRGRLPVAECVEIGIALASALAHLHKEGLVHRDVKPSNIIFVGGVLKLADIGLVADLSEARSFVGTEGFIPPEGPGKPQADLYSLGKVLYEAATGRNRLDFPDLPQDWDAWSAEEQIRLREFNEVLVKACDADPRRRYWSAEEMQRDLEQLAGGGSLRRQRTLVDAMNWGKRVAAVALLVVILAAAFVWIRRSGVESAGAPVPTVFVLPFRAEGTNEVPGDLPGRMTDAFIDGLAAAEGVVRSPRKSGWIQREEGELLQSLAWTNGARRALTGRLGLANGQFTLGLRLYERGRDRPVWMTAFSATTNAVVDLERRGLEALAVRLGLRLSMADQTQTDRVLTNNLEAMRSMREAEAIYVRRGGTMAGYNEVFALAQKAVDIDPRFLGAEAQTAYLHRMLAQDRSPNEVWPVVHRTMSRILEQDDTQVIALDQMSGYLLFYRREWDGAHSMLARLFRSLPPQDRHWFRAFWLRIYGWSDEARAEQAASETPEPVHPDVRYFMSSSRWATRQWEDGVRVSRRTLELQPGHAEGYFWLAHCLVGGGQWADGLDAIQKAQEKWKRQELTALTAYVYARMGDTGKAKEVLQELMNSERSVPYLQPYFVARVHAALGDKAMAQGVWLAVKESRQAQGKRNR